MKKRVLVTGSNGQLGRSIQDYVKNKPNDDYVFVFKDSKTLDISNENVMEDFFFSNSFDYIINAAAYTNVDGAEDEVEKAFQVNADGVKYLAKGAKENNAVLVQVSTDYVFDGTKEGAYIPSDSTNPINVYGKSKLEGEKNAQKYNDKTFIVRTSWVYSPYGNNFVKTMKRLFNEREEIGVVADQFGRPTDAYKLATFILENLVYNGNSDYGIYHYASDDAMSWYEFAQNIAAHEKAKISIKPISTEEFPTKAKRPKNSVLS